MARRVRVAVLTLTRDRLDYTKHCFAALRDFAGCDYDHYVLDNDSQDGTVEWLAEEYDCVGFSEQESNIGVARGMNILLDNLDGAYDVIVKFDNDCELTRHGTLETACSLVHENPTWILSPRIQGLDSPPSLASEVNVGGQPVGIVNGNIGGIFMATPASWFASWRYNDSSPIWGMDDVDLCHQWRLRGGEVGYLLDYDANHYETTQGQRARYADYFERKDREFAGR